MKSVTYLFYLTLICSLLVQTSLLKQAQAETAATTLYKDCSIDLEKYCAKITPGAGRKVACLIAHSDKVNPRCRLTSFLAGKELARTMNRLEQLAFICGSDIKSMCDQVLPGGARIYKCLKNNKAKLLERCANAMPEFEQRYLQ